MKKYTPPVIKFRDVTSRNIITSSELIIEDNYASKDFPILIRQRDKDWEEWINE